MYYVKWNTLLIKTIFNTYFKCNIACKCSKLLFCKTIPWFILQSIILSNQNCSRSRKKYDFLFLWWNNWSRGTCKVRNEIETKRNETDRNETKSNETKWNETKRNEIFLKRNVTKKKWKIQYGLKTKRVYNILIIQI